jgi:hypothetical protein
MIRNGKIAPLTLACIASLIGLCGSAAPAFAAGTLKAAYVEQVIPARTFSDSMVVLNSPTSVGPGTGILGITSLTLTNFDTSPQQVFIFVPTFAGGTCGSPVIGGSTPRIQVYVQALSTMHLTYPTPWVVNPVNNVTCIAAEVTTLLHGGSVEVDVNGVVN